MDRNSVAGQVLANLIATTVGGGGVLATAVVIAVLALPWALAQARVLFPGKGRRGAADQARPSAAPVPSGATPSVMVVHGDVYFIGDVTMR